jgi:hypothetical protein
MRIPLGTILLVALVASACGTSSATLKTAGPTDATAKAPAATALASSDPASSKPSVPVGDTIPLSQILAEQATAPTWNRSLSNAGTPADVARVKAAVVDLMTAEADMFVQPAPGSRTRADQQARKTGALERIPKVWAAAAKERRAGLEEAANRLGESATDDTVVGFSKARYVVDEWTTVAVSGDSATVQATGHLELFSNPSKDGANGWTKQIALQNQWTLTKENGSWLFAERIAEGAS